jgi:pyruvate dehydrogenase E1 component alpha subunit
MVLHELYRQMLRARHYELAVEELWQQGQISGEMHLGTGEEAVAAGVVSHLRTPDGLALTHRCSPALVVRGVPLVPMLRELLGREDGLCRGRGGHMHLFSKEHGAATSGIVGASLPTGAGFALAAKRRADRSMAVAFTGDGALNQGMALETLNLAVALKLPLLVVCVDNGWAITTRSGSVTGGDLSERAAAFGFVTEQVDGTDVLAVHEAAATLVGRARDGKGPGFLRATCPRLDGHFLGDPLVRQAQSPIAEGADTLKKVVGAAMSSSGAGTVSRLGSMVKMMGTMARARQGVTRDARSDPMSKVKKQLRGGAGVEAIERQVAEEIRDALQQALASAPSDAGGDDA